MEQRIAGIRHPELLLIASPDQAGAAFGCDQDWYADRWQRQAGCGPCTAATILMYLALSRPGLARLYPAASRSQEDYRHFMSDVWHYVTPGRMGVNEGSILAQGVQAYAAERQVSLLPSICSVPGRQQCPVRVPEFAGFIQAGLAQDCPVAFLNLSNGSLPNLDSWHWVTITELLADDTGEILAIIADSGTRKTVSLSLWCRTTVLGGAAVWFSADPGSSPEANPPPG